MARGFESKDVEFQQAERERLHDTTREHVTDEKRAEASRRRTVELSLAKLRGDRARARVDAHRVMLDQAIATLEAELASLS